MLHLAKLARSSILQKVASDQRRALALLLAGIATILHPEPVACSPGLVIREVFHLTEAGEPQALGSTYTLGGDSRPVIQDPGEKKISLTAKGGGTELSFPIPLMLSEGARFVVGGSYHTEGTTVLPIPPTIRTVRETNGKLVSTIPLPVIANIPGTKTVFSLRLAPLPAKKRWKLVTKPVTIPKEATLEVSLGIANSGRVQGAVPIELSVALRPESGGEQELLRTVIDPNSPEAKVWTDEQAALKAFGGMRARFVFRARPAREGLALLFPLFADPRITVASAREPDQRNLILISLDTLGAKHLGSYGSQRRTSPAIDALGREGVVVERAYAQWPETAGSHMSLFTARYVSEHGVRNFLSQPPASVRTLAQQLRANGYLTKAFTEDGGVWAEAGFARGFHSYRERRSPDFVYRGEAAATFTEARNWIKRHRGHLFFLFVHTYQVHAPYRPPRGYRNLFGKTPPRGPVATDELNYDREIAFTDHQVGTLIATVKQLDLQEKTIVIVTADHGEEFGEHGGRGHGRTLYSEVIHVPLIFWAPGLLQPHRVSQVAALIDLWPTVTDLLGLEHPDRTIAGRSLLTALQGKKLGETDEVVISELDREGLYMLAVRSGTATLIRDLSAGKSSCYPAGDATEVHSDPSLCKDLATIANRHLRASRRGKTGHAITVDAETRAKMKALGYIQ